MAFPKIHFSRPYGYVSIGGLALLLAVAYWALRDGNGQADFTTHPVQRGNIEQLVTATGALQPRDFVDVGAQVSGQLRLLRVQVGDTVKAGDLLAEIDTTVYAARVDATRAQLRNQQAHLQDREAQLTLAQINHRRAVNLRRADATTEEEVQRSEAALRSAEAQLRALQAQLQQTESSLRVEEANLEFARIYAPMDGTVVSISARQGQTLNASQTAPLLMRIADLSTMTVHAQVSEADIGKLRLDMPVYFTVLGGDGRRWYSELQRIEPTPEVLNNVVLYNALFDVPNAEGRLMTQMTAQIFFIAAQAQNVLLAPAAALSYVGAAERSPAGSPDRAVARGERRGERNEGRTQQGRAASVRVVASNGQVQQRDVRVGVSNRVRAEILEGLAEGEEVIVGDARAAVRQQDNTRNWGMRMMR